MEPSEESNLISGVCGAAVYPIKEKREKTRDFEHTYVPLSGRQHQTARRGGTNYRRYSSYSTISFNRGTLANLAQYTRCPKLQKLVAEL